MEVDGCLGPQDSLRATPARAGVGSEVRSYSATWGARENPPPTRGEGLHRAVTPAACVGNRAPAAGRRDVRYLRSAQTRPGFRSQCRAGRRISRAHPPPSRPPGLTADPPPCRRPMRPHAPLPAAPLRLRVLRALCVDPRKGRGVARPSRGA